MGLNETVSANRIHIGFFGKRNAGKSSVVNALANQQVSVVSDVPGTTTDPVKKAMELLPLGPVVLIDTPGFDDEGALGELRVETTRKILETVDVAVIVIDATDAEVTEEAALVNNFKERNVPVLVVGNKKDRIPEGECATATRARALAESTEVPYVQVCMKKMIGIEKVKEALAAFAESGRPKRFVIADLLSPGDHAVLVVPIDASAPKGRLILPQQQTIRDILDAHATCSITQVDELERLCSNLSSKPRIVITDSQVFKEVAKRIPEDYALTSFSILMARYKGVLEEAVAGANVLDEIADGDKILISEGCTHHRQCGDIGTVKLPALIRKYTGKEVDFTFTSGLDFPLDVSDYKVVIHCGACTLNDKEMKRRSSLCKENGVLLTNYGIAMAKMNGILERSISFL